MQEERGEREERGTEDQGEVEKYLGSMMINIARSISTVFLNTAVRLTAVREAVIFHRQVACFAGVVDA